MLQHWNKQFVLVRVCQAGKVVFSSLVFLGELVEGKPLAQEPQNPVTAFLSLSASLKKVLLDQVRQYLKTLEKKLFESQNTYNHQRQHCDTQCDLQTDFVPLPFQAQECLGSYLAMRKAYPFTLLKTNNLLCSRDSLGVHPLHSQTLIGMLYQYF